MFKVSLPMLLIMISFVFGGFLGRQVRALAYNKVIEGPKKAINATPSVTPTPTQTIDR